MFETVLPRDRGAFARSVLPTQPAHWLLILGSFFLFISHEARWLPSEFSPGVKSGPASWRLTAWVLSLPLMASGAAGWYLALLETARPARRVLLWVIAPASITLLGIAALSAWDVALPLSVPGSIVETTLNGENRLEHFVHVFVAMGFAMKLALSGLAMVVCFFVLLAKGKASLPVTIGIPAPRAASTSEFTGEIEEGRRLMRFVWMMISLPILAVFASLPLNFILAESGAVFVQAHLSLSSWLIESWYDIALLVLVFFAIDKESRREIGRYFRLPQLKYLLLGIVLPAIVACLWPLIDFAHHLILWSRNLRGSFFPPQLSGYITAPTLHNIQYLPAALVEEIAWRGYLQPRLIRRYGLIRGIVLVGVVWGVFHFYFDFDMASSWKWVGERVLVRILGTVVLSFPLAWLTIRSRSILPAALFHAVHNTCLHVSSFGLRWHEFVLDALYAVLGYVLFRYFPPPLDETSIELPQPETQPAPEAASSEV